MKKNEKNYLEGSEIFPADYDGQDGTRYNQEKNSKIVVGRVLSIGRLEDKLNEVKRGEGGEEEEDFHDGVVKGGEVPE